MAGQGPGLPPRQDAGTRRPAGGNQACAETDGGYQPRLGRDQREPRRHARGCPIDRSDLKIRAQRRYIRAMRHVLAILMLGWMALSPAHAEEPEDRADGRPLIEEGLRLFLE